MNDSDSPKLLTKQLLFAFSLLAAIILIIKVRLVLPNDLIVDYPFITYDGFQWITDGLHYTDNSIEVIQRNPALPIIFALLKQNGIETAYPFITSILLIKFFIAIYFCLSKYFRATTSLFTVICFFFTFRIHNFFDYILADPWCLTLLTISIANAVHCTDRPKLFILFAASLGLAFNFQYAPAFCAPAFLYFIFQLWRSGWIWKNKGIFFSGSVLFFSIALPQFIYKYFQFGNPIYSGVVHFGILGVHFWGIPYYLIGFLSFFGIPFAFLISFGLLKSAKEAQPGKNFYLILIGSNLFVWVILYKWLDIRFLLYFLPSFAFFFAVAIEKIFPLGMKQSFNLFRREKKVLVATFLFLGFNLASFKLPAFEGSKLPVSPWSVIVFEMERVSPPHWTDAPILNKFTIEFPENKRWSLPMFTYFRFYRNIPRRNQSESKSMITDLVKLNAFFARRGTTPPQKVGLCDGIFQNHELKHSIFWHIRLNVVACDANDAVFRIRRKQAPFTMTQKTLFYGDFFVLDGA